MKAVALNEYGGPDVLMLRELPDPKIGPDVVLVRARAASVNPVDWKVRDGHLDGAFYVHFPLVPGWDVAGVVEAVGPSITEFAPGDEVIGYVRRDEIQHGTYAELVPAPIRALAPKPRSVGFEEAAALPLAGLTAYQALDAASVARGDTVVVHAAAGGVGSFAVQLAVHRGARVIGTASEGNHDYLRSLGAEPVAYGDGLVEAVLALSPDGVDAALDLVGGDALAVSPRLVRRAGRIVSVIDADTVKRLGGRYVFVRPEPRMLGDISRLVDEGVLRVTIARTFPLAEAAAAQELSQTGHGRGKIVITVP
jgi:NADPH:quinone reductase-like Zn-dependent oxidoreductase